MIRKFAAQCKANILTYNDIQLTNLNMHVIIFIAIVLNVCAVPYNNAEPIIDCIYLTSF